jgi:adenylate cyclase
MAPQVERRLAAILSADVVGYSRLMAEDESATVDAVTAYREQVEVLVRQHRGRLVDFTGDNFLAEFPTATEALSCAVEIQGVLQVRNAGVVADRRMQFRIGIHVGEIRVEEERIYGDGVNIAARLEGRAEPGGICVSGAVYEQVKGRARISFEDLGEQRLKNISAPVQAYSARWSEPAGIEAGSPAIAQSEPSVAVLPFVNMSRDPDQEYFADGMAEELINALTKVEGLRVIARTSAFSFKGTSADIATIGEKLNVSAVVEGSVRKAGDRLRITAQLIDVAGGHHLWSEVFDRSLEDVFQIQDEIARTIVRTIKPKLLGDSAAPLVSRPTESQEAYELYLRAVERIGRFDRWDTRTAIEMLKDATSIDPDYTDAWARLAVACSQMDPYFDSDPRWHEEAARAVERAFELDPDSAEVQFAHSRVLWTPAKGFQNHAALRALQRALELQPGSQQLRLWLGVVLIHVGLLDEGREALGAALAAEPDDAVTLNCLGQAAFYGGAYEEADDYYERARAASATFLMNQIFTPVIRIYRDDLAGAEEALKTARRVVGEDPILDANEALLWARRGEVARADEALSRAMTTKRSVGHSHHAWHHAAAAQAVLGRTREAIAWIREASACGLPNYPLFRGDPHLAPVRDEPEMKKLMSELERECASFRQEFGEHRAR